MPFKMCVLCMKRCLNVKFAFVPVSRQSTKEEEEEAEGNREEDDKGKEATGEKEEAPTKGSTDPSSPQK